MFQRSTGSIIRSALYSQPGILSHELGALADLTYDPRALVELQHHLHSKLSKILKSGKLQVPGMDNFNGKDGKNITRLTNFEGNADLIEGSRNSLAENNIRSSLGLHDIRRSSTSSSKNSANSRANSVKVSFKNYVADGVLFSKLRGDGSSTVLKCLAIIIYLCQAGSPQFFAWLVAQYRALVQPITTLVFEKTLSHAIQQKAQLVIEYCEDGRVLAQARAFLLVGEREFTRG